VRQIVRAHQHAPEDENQDEDAHHRYRERQSDLHEGKTAAFERFGGDAQTNPDRGNRGEQEQVRISPGEDPVGPASENEHLFLCAQIRAHRGPAVESRASHRGGRLHPLRRAALRPSKTCRTPVPQRTATSKFRRACSRSTRTSTSRTAAIERRGVALGRVRGPGDKSEVGARRSEPSAPKRFSFVNTIGAGPRLRAP